MRHLASATVLGPAGSSGDTGCLFLAFGGPVCADRISNCPLDRVLTYKNLIYLLNLQFDLFSRLSTYGFLLPPNTFYGSNCNTEEDNRGLHMNFKLSGWQL